MSIKIALLCIFVPVQLFASKQKCEDRPIVILIHPGLSKAEMHCKDINKIFNAQFEHAPVSSNSGYHQFQCSVDDPARIFAILQAITEAEAAAKTANINGFSQWIKKPGCSVALKHKTTH